MLKTQTDTEEMMREVLSAAEEQPEVMQHSGYTAVFEHGQWWIHCADCRAQWSVCDATGGASIGGFDFEQVSEGDDSCSELEEA